MTSHVYQYWIFTECGKIYNRVTKLILNGRTPQKYGGSPWHVAIYDISEEDKPLICAGSVISPQLIVSGENNAF